MESNVFFIQDANDSIYTQGTDPNIMQERLCLIRTNENMLNLAYDNQAYLDIPCLPPVADVSPLEGSVCWTAGWGHYNEVDEFGNTSNHVYNQEKSRIIINLIRYILRILEFYMLLVQ